MSIIAADSPSLSFGERGSHLPRLPSPLVVEGRWGGHTPGRAEQKNLASETNKNSLPAVGEGEAKKTGWT